jgi:hypothetical protein
VERPADQPGPTSRSARGWAGGGGRFLIRLSDQEKIKTPFERAWRETPKSGVFLVHRRRQKVFWRRKNFRVASLGSVWQKTAHIKLILCVSNKLFY